MVNILHDPYYLLFLRVKESPTDTIRVLFEKESGNCFLSLLTGYLASYNWFWSKTSGNIILLTLLKQRFTKFLRLISILVYRSTKLSPLIQIRHIRRQVILSLHFPHLPCPYYNMKKMEFYTISHFTRKI